VDSLCASGLHVNICLKKPSSDLTNSLQTNHKVVNCVTQHGTCASPEQCAGSCGTYDLWGSPKGNKSKDSSPVNVTARSTHSRNGLEIDSVGYGSTTFAACGCAPSCWKSVSTRLAPWMNRMTSFCSFCRCSWFVGVPSTKIGPISPCLLTAHHAVHFVGWSDLSTTGWTFREPEPAPCSRSHRGGNGIYHLTTGGLRCCSLLVYEILTLPHPVVPPFAFHTSHSPVARISNCCVFFWTPWTLKTHIELSLFNGDLLTTRKISFCSAAVPASGWRALGPRLGHDRISSTPAVC
jgi:hypothetical protein